MTPQPANGKRIRSFLAKADESLAAARLLLREGHTDFAASRAYYAAFYAATAALACKGLNFSTHRGLISAVHQHLVHTGVLEVTDGEAIGSLFEVRLIADYEALPPRMTARRAEEIIDLADRFVADIKNHICKELRQ